MAYARSKMPHVFGPVDQPTKELTEGGDLRERAGRRPSVCLSLRRLMSYIYGAPILDVSRSHTTTQHSR